MWLKAVWPKQVWPEQVKIITGQNRSGPKRSGLNRSGPVPVKQRWPTAVWPKQVAALPRASPNEVCGAWLPTLGFGLVHAALDAAQLELLALAAPVIRTIVLFFFLETAI